MDGNKRTAYVLAKEILLVFSMYFKVHYKEAVHFIIEIAQGKKSHQEIEEWIKGNTESIDSVDDYSSTRK